MTFAMEVSIPRYTNGSLGNKWGNVPHRFQPIST